MDSAWPALITGCVQSSGAITITARMRANRDHTTMDGREGGGRRTDAQIRSLTTRPCFTIRLPKEYNRQSSS